MCSIVAALLILLSGFAGYRFVEDQVAPFAQTDQQTEAARTSCADASAQDDVRRALAIGGDLFDAPLWTVDLPDDEYTEITTVNWISNRLNAVAHVDYVQFNCGVTHEQIDGYLTEANYQIVYAQWGPYHQTAQCARNNVRLVEFDIQSTYDESYYALYWVKQMTPTRVALVNLIFPVSLAAKEASYARQLFLELPTCS